MKVINVNPFGAWIIRSGADLSLWQERFPDAETFKAPPPYPYAIRPNPMDAHDKPRSFIIESYADVKNLMLELERPPQEASYVLGFMFGKTGMELNSHRHVLLLRKRYPARQNNQLNGIGGHLNPGEEPHAGMVREFREETGIETTREDWTHYLTITQPGVWKMDVFCGAMDIKELRHAEANFKSSEPLSVNDVFFLLGGHSQYRLVEHVMWMMIRAIEIMRTRSSSVQYIRATQGEAPV